MTKTKSKHHKEENTFRFQTLSERLKDLKVEVGRTITRYNDKPEETETYFYNGLEKWVDLNYTSLFYEFALQTKTKCRTLAILIFNKDSLVDSIIDYLAKSNELSIQPVLDLTVQLSRDLQNDFYAYFPRIFNAITQLLDTQNTDILEWAFQTLSYLFKFLWRYMLKDLHNVYELYSPLFGEDRKEYIRNFAAESFAFLMRKIVDKNELFDFLLVRLINHPEESKGISQLIFGMFKGVQHQFNACTEKSLLILLDKLNYFSCEKNLANMPEDYNKISVTDDNRPELNELVFTCIAQTFESMSKYTKRQHTDVVWKCVYAKVDEFRDRKENMIHLMQIISGFLEANDCYFIEDLDLFLENMEKVGAIEIGSGSNPCDKKLTECFFNLVQKALLSGNLKFPIEKTTILPNILYQTKYDCESICYLTRRLFTYSIFEKVVLPNLLKYFDAQINASGRYEKELLQLLSEYMIKHRSLISIDSTLELTEFATGDSQNTDFFEFTVSARNLTYFMRCLEAKKNDGLLQSLLQFLNNNYKSLSLQSDLCILAPFLLKNSKDMKKNTSIFDLTKETFTRIKASLVDRSGLDPASLEQDCLLLSLGIWSLMMHKNEVFFAQTSPVSLQSLVELLSEFEQLRVGVIKDKSVDLFDVEKSFAHVLRSVYLVSVYSLNESRSDGKLRAELLEPVGSVFDLLKSQLSSPFHQNRLNSLSILHEFSKLHLTKKTHSADQNNNHKSEADIKASEEDQNIFLNCLRAEKTPASLDEHRHKIVYLQRLDAASSSKFFDTMENKEGKFDFTDVPLRYIFGVLFENFKLIWEPLVSLVQSYAHSMKLEPFWNIFGAYITGLSDVIEAEIATISHRSEPMDVEEANDGANKFSGLMVDSQQNVDYRNVRFLLCQAMQDFVNSCEARTRLLVPIFFRFVNNEYYAVETRLNAHCFDDLFDNSKKDRNVNKSQRFTNKAVLNKYLCAYLDIFAKFTSPTSWYLESSLRSLFLNLLCHNEASVQKSALNCLNAYKYPFLVPYKSHFEKLLEGKHFRHELVVFSLEEKSGKVHADHRQQLLPILMRLLYGKFYSNETTHTSSKDTKTNKRATIIQFLSCCNEYELNYFFNLLFDCLTTVLDDTKTSLSLEMPASESDTDRYEVSHNTPEQRDQFVSHLLISLNDTSSTDSIYKLSKVIPLKKLLGILHSLEIIINKLARQLEHFSHRILQILCFIHKYSFSLNELASKSNVDDYYTGLLRVIRQQVTLRFKQFFDTFDHLNFSQQEHLLVMDSFIWPLTSKLKHEAVKSVSNLLKIFGMWSERPYYYPLFAIRTCHFNNVTCESSRFIADSGSYKQCLFGDKTVLDMLFELIDNDKCSQQVIDFVMDMVYNLVSFADFKEEEQEKQQAELTDAVAAGFFNLVNTKPLPFDADAIKAQFDLTITKSALKNDEINFGTCILKPHVTSIVDHIERIVTDNLAKKNLPTKPLKILARLSCFASNSAQQCEKIIQLLTSYLIKNRKQSEEIEINILDSINNLLRQVRNVSDFVCPLGRLFSVIKNRMSRVELCKVFATIKELEPKYAEICQISIDLNAWDAKRLEEPDYMLRLDAFAALNKLIDDWTAFDIQLASLLVYNCFFFLNNIDDLAIKESSTNCVRGFLLKSASLELLKSDKCLLESNFISEIKNGLRNKSENARHEFVKVFVQFIRSFKHVFGKYEDLAVLMDTEDVERDFFENIIHIQMHRRSRAMKRLQRACDERLISTDNLLSFIMPLARSFVDNDMYHKYDYIVEEACNSIGAICYVLSWPKYLKVIEYYLKIMNEPQVMSQKMVIKILVSALDAFHFDLSNSNAVDYYTQKRDENETDDDEEDDEKENMDVAETTTKPQVKTIPAERTERVKQTVSKAQAFKIHSTITKAILPTLNKCLTKRLTNENEHKMNKKEDMDEQILRVPMALAILKLLKNLPAKTFETHLPGLLYKICEMLKSRAISVRNTTRECLIKMINELPDKKYYFYVFKELSNSLTRGYQVHVLCYTVQMILKQIEPKLSQGDLDSSMGILVNGCCLELFSDVSEEKEERKIIAKTPEAKHMSSFNTLEVLSQYITASHVLGLLKPFKEKLDECNSNKLLKKIEEALKRITQGLLKNSSLDTERLLVFVYGLVNDTFDMLKNPGQYKKGIKFSQVTAKQAKEAGEDFSCLLLPSEPKRGGEKPKVNTKTNQHVIVEFALQLMNHMLKSNRINSTNSPMLDPYLAIFVEYLEGKYVKLTIATLRCLMGFLKFSLPSLGTFSNQIASKLFLLLQTYSSSTTLANSDTQSNNQGDNFELLMICFKVIANLIRDCANFSLTEDQLQVLMHYAERNLYDNLKQSSSFNLIKAVLSRRLKCEELTDVLGKIMKMSIQADSANVRLQSRQTILQYILEYSLAEKKLVKFLEFYIVQLNYEFENGRESALEMMATIFGTFPTVQLNTFASRFFLPLAIQLHNDESAKCKKLANLALKHLIEKIGSEERNTLFNLTLALLKNDDKALHKRIACLLVKVFVDVEGTRFEPRLPTVLDLLITELNFDTFNASIESNSSSLITEKFYDQYLFNLLSLVLKIYKDCNVLAIATYSGHSNKLFDEIKKYLEHDHLWVRLTACQLFGLLFSSRTCEDLFSKPDSYFNHKAASVHLKIRDLIDSFVVQLKSPLLEPELAEQIIKNLAFMGKLVNKYPSVIEEVIEGVGSKHDLNTEWLIKKVIKEAKYELVKKPNETIKRTFIFKWLAALTLDLGKEKLKDYLNLIVPSLQRETLVNNTDDPKFDALKKLAQEVLEFIKQTIGVEEFSVIYSKAHMRRVENKEQRKRKMAQVAVTDPQLAALQKIRKMQKKKEAKKRKQDNSYNPDGSRKNLGKKRRVNCQKDDDF